MKPKFVKKLAAYVDALHSIIYINNFDFHVIDAAISEIGYNTKIVEYNNALGIVDFYSKTPKMECSLEKFLLLCLDDGFEEETFLVLKDIHEELKNPKVLSLLRRIAEKNLYCEDYYTTI